MSRSIFATWILPAIAVAALGGAAWSIAHSQPSRPMIEPAIAPPRPKASVAGGIGAVGLVESASQEIGLPAAVAGVVAAVNVVPGQSVHAGDILFAIDDRQARADYAVQQAALAAARARFAEARTIADDQNEQLARNERLNTLGGTAAISQDTLLRRRFAARTAEAHAASAQADIASAEAQAQSSATTLARLAVRAPIDGTVLQVNVRVGEFAPAQILTTPLVVMGQLTPLHLRADIDEADVPRFRPDAEAWASPRGAAEKRVKLALVRVEPYVVPKTSLTGAGTERVDTRVLRVVYAFDPAVLPSFPGQQMDIFIAP